MINQELIILIVIIIVLIILNGNSVIARTLLITVMSVAIYMMIKLERSESSKNKEDINDHVEHNLLPKSSDEIPIEITQPLPDFILHEESKTFTFMPKEEVKKLVPFTPILTSEELKKINLEFSECSSMPDDNPLDAELQQSLKKYRYKEDSPDIILSAGFPYKYTHNKLGSKGDNDAVRKMSHISSMNKRALDSASRLGANTFRKYFDEELRDASNIRWWDNDNLEQYM
jgi:hypothetical protein